MSILDAIDSPVDLRNLPESDLPFLAQELRNLTIDIVAGTGGHLGASLGVIELTIALHYVFDTPEDRLIWDVGHQSYPHKILTGRRNLMSTLRQKGGISGFTKRAESCYDPFGTGHSSTSISAALGMAVASELHNNNRKCIAVIGDGAMTAGLAFEALNNAGAHKKSNLLVILNDNEMSISHNVGALSSYLSRIWSSGFYSRFKDGTGRVLNRISPPLKEVVRRAEGHVKGLITPGTLFEELGFDYIGPIDGHDFHQLLPNLRNISRLNGPILLHVVTKKGKGYLPAENNPCTYHGVPPFDRQSGAILEGSTNPTFTQIFSETLIDLARQNEKIVAITAAMPEGTGLNVFQSEFPQRFFDVGIAEQHAVTFAAGMACEGFIPVVAIYSTFLQRAYDQIIHDVALQNLPVVFILDRAGLVGKDGPTHAGAYDMSFLRTIPDITLMAPADENELRHMLLTAVALNKPVCIRFPRGTSFGLTPEQPTQLTEGTGRQLRIGQDVAILSIGHLLNQALKAADLLTAQNISVSVYDCRFIKPIDQHLLRQAANQHKLLITLEEGTLCGGFGSAILEFFASEDKHVRIRCIGLPDRFIPHGSQDELRRDLSLDGQSIANQITALLS